MQYHVNTPSEYFQALEEDWRKEKLLALRALIQEKIPNLTEGIQYKMLSYSDDKGTLFHLNAQKAYVSLYVGDAAKVDSDGTLLQGINVGKGCLRFSKSVVIANTRIDEFIERYFQLWKDGVDIGC